MCRRLGCLDALNTKGDCRTYCTETENFGVYQEELTNKGLTMFVAV